MQVSFWKKLYQSKYVCIQVNIYTSIFRSSKSIGKYAASSLFQSMLPVFTVYVSLEKFCIAVRPVILQELHTLEVLNSSLLTTAI